MGQGGHRQSDEWLRGCVSAVRAVSRKGQGNREGWAQGLALALALPHQRKENRSYLSGGREGREDSDLQSSPRLRFPTILMTALHQVLPLGLQGEPSFPHTPPPIPFHRRGWG